MADMCSYDFFCADWENLCRHKNDNGADKKLERVFDELEWKEWETF